jgi:hypothetical protein
LAALNSKPEDVLKQPEPPYLPPLSITPAYVERASSKETREKATLLALSGQIPYSRLNDFDWYFLCQYIPNYQ